MFKLLLLVGVVSAFVDDDQVDKVYSLHTRFTPGSLNLTTGELKLFSGHAMNIIQSKCPNVDAKKIFQVQKYMGKLLAKNEPVPGTSKEFKLLLESMTVCAKEGVIAKPAEPEFDPSDMHFSPFPFFPPFHRVRKVFVQRIPGEGTPPAGVDSGLLRHSTETPITKTGPLPGPTPPPPRMITTTIFVRPQDMKEGIKSSGGFFNWIHNLFARVKGFFKNPFGRRAKRGLPDSLPPPLIAEEIMASLNLPQAKEGESNGKQSFGALIDQMCRIYCDSCTVKKEIRYFKMAAKQLLADLFEEDSGLEAAAKQYLDDDFLDSIKKCE
ncbi:hypothetical protein Fcan01_14709 [Folsomia candida]|uniref:Uncharacterized protein n=2 Tax=Folsomia candida TaxID=158441 RepID=A0A226E0R4_FOLCA|nr:hypothetical protein Fcan01_14709 [Folsomia candida]